MEDTRPNILLLFTDQQRFDTIRAAGSRFGAKTPNMDALVSSGMHFRNTYCTAPVCSPSRSSIVTGQHPVEAGMPGNLYADTSLALSPAVLTLGHRMRRAGYETVYHGKWHLGSDLRECGFDVGEECSHDASTVTMAARYWRDRDWKVYDRPFFQVVSLLDPHDLYFFDPEKTDPKHRRPWENLDRTSEEYPSAVRNKQVAWSEEKWSALIRFYVERIEKVDRDIGVLLDELNCSGFFPNTWILFFSDHGDMTGEHNIPFKGPYMYEGVTRVPLTIVPPQTRFSGNAFHKVRIPKVRRGVADGLCSLLDIAPTVLDLAGLEQPPEMSGHSLLPVLTGEDPDRQHDFVFASWDNPAIQMIRSADGWKYILYANGEEELYQLAEDPSENENRANDSTCAGIRKQLRTHLREHLKNHGGKFNATFAEALA